MTSKTSCRRPPLPPANLAALRAVLGPRYATLVDLAALAGKHHMSLCLVGGSVRDLLRHEGGRDIDLVVEGSAPQLAQAAAQLWGGQTWLSNGFQTATWRPPRGPAIDLASARSESYAAAGALPTVQMAPLSQDLWRRDFSVNAMAIPLHGPDAGQLIDPTAGFADLSAGVLRVLHARSFADDPTRALRAARLAARLNYHLTPATRAQLRKARQQGAFAQVSCQRLGRELDLLLDEAAALPALRLLRAWRLGTCLHPDLTLPGACLRRVAATLRARWRCADLLQPLPRQADILWIVLAATVPPRARGEFIRLARGGRAAAAARLLRGPERIAAARRSFDASARLNWEQAAENLDLIEAVNLLACPLSAGAKSYLRWWLRHGRHIRSTVDGDTLRKLGHAAGPPFKAALQAALREARRGGDAAAQLQVAMASLKKVDR